MELKIDEEFKALIRPLSDDERERLKASISKDGIWEPIKFWTDGDGDNLIVDGMNRFEIAGEIDESYFTSEMHFESRDEAKLWILQNQLGRRNLNHSDRILAVNQYKHIKGDPLGINLPRPTVREVKEDLGMEDLSDRQVNRIINASEIIDELPRSIRGKLERGEVQYSEASLKELDELDEDMKLQVIDLIQYADGESITSVRDAINLAKKSAKAPPKEPDYNERGVQLFAKIVALAERRKDRQGHSESYETFSSFIQAAAKSWDDWV